MRKRKKGFTLVELLVVIAIMAVLLTPKGQGTGAHSALFQQPASDNNGSGNLFIGL
jgi:prepilin-type N-terminal cleavage/methylation domain-containing protein